MSHQITASRFSGLQIVLTSALIVVLDVKSVLQSRSQKQQSALAGVWCQISGKGGWQDAIRERQLQH